MLTHDSPPEDTMTALTDAEFTTLAASMTRLSPASLAIARAVLVEGKSNATAAREAGLTPQRVGSILRQFDRLRQEIPRGWVKVELWLPSRLVPVARALEEKAREDLAARKTPAPPRPRGRPRKEDV